MDLAANIAAVLGGSTAFLVGLLGSIGFLWRKSQRVAQLRWKIEEFHLAWKSGGAQVEKQRMQTADNLERMAVILAFVAVRLLQLKEVVIDND